MSTTNHSKRRSRGRAVARIALIAAALEPAAVDRLVTVDLPQPRKLGVRDTVEFVKVAAHLRSLLESC